MPIVDEDVGLCETDLHVAYDRAVFAALMELPVAIVLRSVMGVNDVEVAGLRVNSETGTFSRLCPADTGGGALRLHGSHVCSLGSSCVDEIATLIPFSTCSCKRRQRTRRRCVCTSPQSVLTQHRVQSPPNTTTTRTALSTDAVTTVGCCVNKLVCLLWSPLTAVCNLPSLQREHVELLLRTPTLSICWVRARFIRSQGHTLCVCHRFLHLLLLLLVGCHTDACTPRQTPSFQ